MDRGVNAVVGILDIFINVKIKNNVVYISGVNGQRLALSMRKVQGDNRFAGRVMTLSFRHIELPEFFLPDFYYIVSKAHGVTTHLPYKYTLQRLLKAIEESTWIGDVTKPHPGRLDLSLLSNIHYKPKDYQAEFLEYYSKIVPAYKLKGAMLAAVVGSGKTSMGLMVSECLRAERIVVICPLPAVSRVWEQQINEVFKKPQTYWLSTDKSGYQDQRFAVYHYEALPAALQNVSLHKSSRTVVILDESHNLNNPKSLRTQLFLKLTEQLGSEDILFSSGTPIKALGHEAVVLFKAIDPLFNDDVQRRFTALFGEKTSNANLELLKTRLGQVSFKVTQAQVNIGSPNMIPLKVSISHPEPFLLENVAIAMRSYVDERTTYYAKRYPDDLAFYNRIMEYYESKIIHNRLAMEEFNQYKAAIDRIQVAHANRSLSMVTDEMMFCNKVEKVSIIPTLLPDDKERFKEVKTLIKYASLKIQGEALGRILGRLRVDCHVAMVEGIDFQSIIDEALKKTVIFSSYIDVCQAAVNRLKNMGYTASEVYGSLTKNLSSTVDAFMNKDQYNPLVATYASLSTAVPLVVANTMILINSPFRAYIQEQAIARVHRLGATTATFIYECTLDTGDKPNLSTRGIDILQWSRDQVELITGTKSVYDDSTIIEEGGTLTIANESLGLSHIETYIEPMTLMQKNKVESW